MLQKIDDDFPLWGLLGLYVTDKNFSEQMAVIGQIPELLVVEHTASLEYKEQGISVALKLGEWTAEQRHTDEFCIVGFHLFLRKKDGYHPYTGNVPFGLDAANSRQFVRKILGIPAQSHDGGRGMFDMIIYPWDKFYFGEYGVNIQYSLDCKQIDLVVAMTEFEAKNC